MRHFYLSTACVHELHDRCRLQCKFCEADCACGCHVGSVSSMTETPQDSDLASDAGKDVTVEKAEDVSVPVDQRQPGGTAVGKEDTADTTAQP
jgi:hypothetical protein